MEAEKTLLTVFTPTYNRAALLPRVYESLKRQTDKRFVWLIVDDGSTDDTKETVRRFREEAPFPVIYEYEENGGKMRAHNRGVSLTETEWFLCLDSDDRLTEDAVSVIYESFREMDAEKLPGNPAGLAAHKGQDSITPLYNTDFPTVSYSTLYGLYLKGFRGETTLVFRTEVLRQFPFPEIPGEKYVPEDYIYDKIDGAYVLKVVPRVLTICEVTESGYTESLRKLKRENPTGWFLYYEQRFQITPPSLLKVKYAGYYLIYRKRAGRKLSFFSFWLLPGLGAMAALKFTGRE